MTDLKHINRNLQEENNRLQDQITHLHAHIELQRAEIIMLQNRCEKSANEIQDIMAPPRRKTVKTFKIDNRNR